MVEEGGVVVGAQVGTVEELASGPILLGDSGLFCMVVGTMLIFFLENFYFWWINWFFFFFF